MKESKLLSCFIGMGSWSLKFGLSPWKEEDLGSKELFLFKWSLQCSGKIGLKNKLPQYKTIATLVRDMCKSTQY